MSSVAWRESAQYLDLSSRYAMSETVVASPTANAETIIASVAVPAGATYALGVELRCWAAFTVGTSGTAVTFRVRQTSLTGTVVVSSGALTSIAGNVNERGILTFDTAPGDGQLYKLTMQVTGGAAASTVSAVLFSVLAV